MSKIFDDTHIKPLDMTKFINLTQPTDALIAYLRSKNYMVDISDRTTKTGNLIEIRIVDPQGTELIHRTTDLTQNVSLIQALEELPLKREYVKVMTGKLQKLFAMEAKPQAELFKAALVKVDEELTKHLSQIEELISEEN